MSVRFPSNRAMAKGLAVGAWLIMVLMVLWFDLVERRILPSIAWVCREYLISLSALSFSVSS